MHGGNRLCFARAAFLTSQGGLCAYCQVCKEANHTHAFIEMYDIVPL